MGRQPAAKGFGPSRTEHAFFLNRFLIPLTLAASLIVSGGCGGSFSNPGGPAGITLSAPSVQSLDAGQQTQASVQVTDVSGRILQSTPVTWDTSDTAVMSAAPVDAAGHTAKLTAGSKSGKVTVTARAGTQVATFELTVKGSEPTVLSLANDIQPIFTRSCALPDCHMGPADAAEEGMVLTPGESYSNLVNVKSNQVRSGKILRVEPGNPDTSYLVAKLKGTHVKLGGRGSKMPLDGDLPEVDLQKIIQWIKDGAPNN